VTVTPIAIATNRAGAPIPVGQAPTGIAITPDGTTAYVTDLSNKSVWPLWLATRRLGHAIHVGKGPAAIAIAPSGQTRLRRRPRREHGDAGHDRDE
jgi:DNA-binding beta-propeller fold protein YncE